MVGYSVHVIQAVPGEGELADDYSLWVAAARSTDEAIEAVEARVGEPDVQLFEIGALTPRVDPEDLGLAAGEAREVNPAEIPLPH